MTFGGVFKLNRRGYILLSICALSFLYFALLKNPSTNRVNVKYLLQTAIQAAETGGRLIVASRKDLKIESKGLTREGMEDRVTSADFQSHCAMKDLITSRFPNVKFISEEKSVPCNDFMSYKYPDEPDVNIPDEYFFAKDLTVWIDPLDATHEYTEKLYQYVTTMVCVAVQGQPILGVIHRPFRKTTSWAVVGYGHSSDLDITTNIPVREKDGSTWKPKVIISRSHSGTVQEILEMNFNDIDIMIAAGAGYKVLKVAKGEADAYVHITAIKKWDICAGNAILNALGGKMTTKHGQPLTYYNDTDDNVINKGGVIATMRNHELFVDKL